MDCRIGCGACCIAPSISSALPGMPHGKPAGMRCVNLNAENRCLLWGTETFPAVCRGFPAVVDVCGYSNEEAIRLITALEAMTAPTLV